MPSGDVRSDTGHWKPRLTRAALWALLGGLSFLLGWAGAEGLNRLDLDVIDWGFGPIQVGLLMLGLAFSAALGVAIWRTGSVGWRRAAGFAALAMPWFNLGYYVGVRIYWGIPEDSSVFLIWFAGFLVAGVWATTSGIVLLPVLRSRAGIAWPLAASTGFGAVAGAAALVNGYAMFEVLQYVTAAWCAVQAAAFSMALPQVRLSGGQAGPHRAREGRRS